MSRSRMGRIVSAETRLKISGKNNHWYGKHLTEEQKERIRQARLGKKWSLEARQRMSEQRKGRYHSPESIQRMSENNGRNKLVINQETGIFYRSVSEAAKSINKPRFWLSDKLTGKTKNTTMFRYA